MQIKCVIKYNFIVIYYLLFIFDNIGELHSESCEVLNYI